MLKHTLAAVTLAAALAGTAGAQPQPYEIAIVNVPPPAPYHEVIPAPRRGFVWVPGYWDWNGRRHVWVEGNWMRARPGFTYLPPEWVRRDGRWVLESGLWARVDRPFRDRDGDGIRDRVDRDRDNDGVANRHDRDRDGDGVPNRWDSRPNNPNRS